MYYVIDDRMYIVCYRIADMPKPKVPSQRQRCGKCSEPIWVAKAWPAEPAKVCSHCMKRDGSEKPNRNARRNRHSRLH
jgi:formylmethanofuran dehydrogenase subunit E